jgi:hypothetical protein
MPPANQRGNRSTEEQLHDLRNRLAKAKEQLAVLKSNRERLLRDPHLADITTAEEARTKAAELQAEAGAKEGEAVVLLNRAAKILERFDNA